MLIPRSSFCPKHDSWNEQQHTGITHHLSRRRGCCSPPGPSQGPAPQERVSLICWATCSLLWRRRGDKVGHQSLRSSAVGSGRDPDKSIASGHLGLVFRMKTEKSTRYMWEKKKNHFPSKTWQIKTVLILKDTFWESVQLLEKFALKTNRVEIYYVAGCFT